MIVFDEREKPIVNKHIVDLVSQERTHAIATTIVRADKQINFKPIFNSQLEYSILQRADRTFPEPSCFSEYGRSNGLPVRPYEGPFGFGNVSLLPDVARRFLYYVDSKLLAVDCL